MDHWGKRSRRTAGAGCAFFLLLFSWSCRRGTQPVFLYGSLVRSEEATKAVLVFDGAVDPSPAPDLSFDPPPKGTFSCVRGAGVQELLVVFSDPRPFAGNDEVRVSVERGPKALLTPGEGNPVLESVSWHDTTADRYVDAGDRLVLRFDSPVSVRSEGGVIPASCFLLSGGTSVREVRLGDFSGSGEAGLTAFAGSDGREVVLVLEKGSYFRICDEENPAATFLSLNASVAMPSRRIVAEHTGLGAVSREKLPILPASRRGFFIRRRGLQIGPLGMNIDATCTMLDPGDGKRAPMVVVAGGRNPDPEDLTPSTDVFVFFADTPGAMLWEGHLHYPRIGHAALALPVPPESGLLGAVLFSGGVGRNDRLVREVELLCIRDPDRAAQQTASIVLPFPSPERNLERFLLPRAHHRAVYIEETPQQGIVFLAGGLTAVSGSGFAECFRISYTGGGDIPAITDYSGPIGTLPGRIDHTLTAVAMPGGRKSVLLFGGKLTSGGISVAMPYLFDPLKALGGDDRWREPLTGIDERSCRRQGHGAVFLPESGKVVILGGKVELSSSMGWEPASPFSSEVIEFDCEKKLFTLQQSILFDYRLHPRLLKLPGGEAVLMVGGVGQSDQFVSPLDIYSGDGERKGVFAWGGMLPKEALGAELFLFRGTSGDAAVYCVGGEGEGVWTLDLAEDRERK